MERKRIIGWRLSAEDRDRLAARIAPRYPQVVADHVTLAVDTADPPPPDKSAEVVGVADDDGGVQALVVRIDGSTARPGGGICHITWSLDATRGRKAADSTQVIADHGWRDLDPIPIRLQGAVLR